MMASLSIESPDLLAVGWLANYVREKRHGDITYYNVNRHINPTNVCVAHCKLCAFGRDPDSRAPTLSHWKKCTSAPLKVCVKAPRSFTLWADSIPICPLTFSWN